METPDLWVSVLCVGFAFLCFLIIQRKYKQRKIRKWLAKLPGDRGNFIFGNVLELYCDREDLFDNFNRFIKKYEKYSLFCAWFMFEPRVLITKAAALERLLGTNDNLEKSALYSFIHPWLGLGLLTSSGLKHRRRRKMLTPSFHFRILDNFMVVFNEQAQILNSKLRQQVGKEKFDILPFISLCTLDIICETAMSKSVNAQNDSESEYVKAVYNMSEIINLRCFRPWLASEWMFHLTSSGRLQRSSLKTLHSFTRNVIAERRREYNNAKAKPLSDETSDNIEDIFGQKRRLTFLDTLLESSENGQVLTDESIQEEVDTFMFEGHDTTASGINSVIFAMAHNPEIQQKVHEELDAVFGDSHRDVTLSDLQELKYLECVIKEALRLYPPVPFIGRHLTKDVELDGYNVPAGVTVMVCVYTLHHDPQYFPDPEKFDPERFSTENCAKRHPFAYIPFSAGTRNCIGQKFALMEEKVVVSHLLRNFRVISKEEKKDVKFSGELILRPFKGTWVKLEQRRF